MSELPAYLGTKEVQARYDLRDPRAARALIDAAGGFVVGHRLLVRAADLDAHEDQLRAERRGRARADNEARPRAPRRRGRRPRPADLAGLSPDWWQQDQPTA
jgi:hypothetical protein